MRHGGGDVTGGVTFGSWDMENKQGNNKLDLTGVDLTFSTAGVLLCQNVLDLNKSACFLSNLEASANGQGKKECKEG